MAEEIWLTGIGEDQIKPNREYPLLSIDGSLRLRYSIVVVYSPSAFHLRHSGNGSEWEETKILVKKDLQRMKLFLPRNDSICRRDDYSFVCFWDFLDGGEPVGKKRTLSPQTIERAKQFFKVTSDRLHTVVSDEQCFKDIGIREFLEYDWCVTTTKQPSTAYLSNSRYSKRISIKKHDIHRGSSSLKQWESGFKTPANGYHFPPHIPVPSPPTGPRVTRQETHPNATLPLSSSSSVSKLSPNNAHPISPVLHGLPAKPAAVTPSTDASTTTRRSIASSNQEETTFSTRGATKRSELISPTTSVNDRLQQTKPRGVFDPSRNVLKGTDHRYALTKIESSSNFKHSTTSPSSWTNSAPAPATNTPTLANPSSSSRVPFPFQRVSSINDTDISTASTSPVIPAKRFREPSEDNDDNDDGTSSSASEPLKKAARRTRLTSSVKAHDGNPTIIKLERQLSTLNDVLDYYADASVTMNPSRNSTPGRVTIASLAEKIFELVRERGVSRYPHALETTLSSRSGTDSPVLITPMEIDENHKNVGVNTSLDHDIREVEELRAKLEAAQAENARLERLRVSEANRAESLQQSINDVRVRAKGAEHRAREEELKVKELTRALEVTKAERSDNAKAAAAAANKKRLEDMQQEWEGRVKEQEALLGEVQMERDGLVKAVADLRRGLRERDEKFSREEEALKSTRTELGRVSKKLVDAQTREGTLSKELETCKQSLVNAASREVEERRSAWVEEEERGRQLMKLFHVSLTANTKGTRDTEGVLRAERSRRLAAETAMLEIAQALGFECQ